MRSAWSCSSCVGLLLSALLGIEVMASHVGMGARRRADGVHRVAKAQITAPPLLRRDEATCESGRTQCPDSVGGGCCPSNYECATDMCFATTSAPSTACNREGFFACAANAGGGCCPAGYVCGGDNRCYPPEGVTSVASCPYNYFQCPASLNFGCCAVGMGCAAEACYSTDPVTTTVTSTITTTNSAGRTVVVTETATTAVPPSPPTAYAASNPSMTAKFIPGTVTKLPLKSPEQGGGGGGGGLSPGALGGIIAGVIVLLIVVVVAAYLVIKRLNRVAEIMESKKGSSSGKPKSQSQAQARAQQNGRSVQSPSFADNISYDPLMMNGEALNGSGANTPQPDMGRGRSDSAGFTPSPNMFSPNLNDRSRHASPDPNAGYFTDIPGQPHQSPTPNGYPMMPAPIRSSSESHSTRHQYGGYHYRQQSNASELSADGSEHGNHTQHNSLLSELEASRPFAELPGDRGTPTGRMRSGSGTSVYGHSRHRSNSSGMNPGGGGSGGGGVGLGVPLDAVAETTEMHGYYGPRNQAAGQTAAGLDVEHDISSPVVPGFPTMGSPTLGRDAR